MWRTLLERARSGPSGDACIVGAPTDLRWVSARLAAAAAAQRAGGLMCFLCARLAADDWWHIVDLLATDPQVEGQVCIRLAQLAGSDQATCRLRVRVRMSKCNVTSSPWCAPEEPTHGALLERTFRTLKPTPDGRIRPTLSPLRTCSHGLRVLSGRTISTTRRYGIARDRCACTVAWPGQKGWSGRAHFGRAFWAHERLFGRQHF